MSMRRLTSFLAFMVLLGGLPLSCHDRGQERELAMAVIGSGAGAKTLSRLDAGTNSAVFQGILCEDVRVVNVAIVPGTFHWEDPIHLLSSSEGFGPRTLSLAAATSVSPQIVVSGTYTPEDSEISSSLGFRVTKSVSLEASSSILVPTGAYAVLQAYVNYQQFTWDIWAGRCWTRGTPSLGPGIVGSGSTFRPVGIFFKSCGAYNCAVMGGGVISGGPIPSGPVPPGVGVGGGAGGAGGAGGGGWWEALIPRRCSTAESISALYRRPAEKQVKEDMRTQRVSGARRGVVLVGVMGASIVFAACQSSSTVQSPKTQAAEVQIGPGSGAAPIPEQPRKEQAAAEPTPPAYKKCHIMGGQIVSCAGASYHGDAIALASGAYRKCGVVNGQILFCDGTLFDGKTVTLKDGSYHDCTIKGGQLFSCEAASFEGEAVVHTDR